MKFSSTSDKEHRIEQIIIDWVAQQDDKVLRRLVADDMWEYYRNADEATLKEFILTYT
jgi:hypothetical protein|tara:strand:- start:1216 stop:1389 length:174 start_codon:yes stop_codon:yes gene_type:complete